MSSDDQPIIGLSKEDRDVFFDEVFAKEEGIVLKFDFETKTGMIRSLADTNVYSIDSRALAQTKVELKAGDKVLFAPFEDPDGKDYGKVLRIIEQSA